MDILTFISSIFSSSAWPLTVILLSFLFRRSISKILDSIRLKRVKKGDLEFDFEHDLSQLKEKAEVVALPTKGTKSKTLKLSIQPIPGLLSIDSELQTITQINPAAGIALSWSQVEKELLSAVMRLAVSPDYPPNNSAIQNIQYLKDAKFISDEIYEMLNRLRMLRNKAVHSMSDPVISVLEAEDYAVIAEKAVLVLSSLSQKK